MEEKKVDLFGEPEPFKPGVPEKKDIKETTPKKEDDPDKTVLIKEDDSRNKPVSKSEAEEIIEKIEFHEEKIEPTFTPRKKIKFSMKFKMTILTATLVAIMMLALSFYLLQIIKNNKINDMRAMVRISTENLTRVLSEIFDSDMERHTIIKENKGAYKDIEKISVVNLKMELVDIVDHTGDDTYKLLLSARVNETAKKKYLKLDKETVDFLNEKPLFEKEYTENGEDKISFITPVKDFNKTTIGYIKTDFTLKNIYGIVNDIQLRIIVLIAFALFLGITLSYLLSSHIIRPINKLSKGAQIIGSGNLKYKIMINTKDELEQLADEFNDMTAKILEAQGHLAEKERMEEQLEIAKTIQENLLVDKFPELDEMEFSAFYKAAQGVGGDYYDVIYQEGSRQIGSVIADVSGKGVPAALIMVMIRTVLHSTFQYIKSANEAIQIINKGISKRLAGDKFATIFYFNYDIDTGKIEYSNGAHSPLLVYKKKYNQIVEFDTEGTPVGIDPDAEFGVHTAFLSEGDVLVNYTDGIYEAMNEKDELFQAARVKDIILKNSQLSAEGLKNKIIDEINKFVGKAPQHDDMTLTIIKIKRINKKININKEVSKPAGPPPTLK